MIRRTIMLLALAKLAACAGPRPAVRPIAPPPAWLVGAWAPAGAGCATDAGVIYHADGGYEMLEERGRWALSGGRLTLRVTETEDEGIRPGATRTVRIRRIADDTAEVTPPSTPSATLTRCPAR